MKLRIDTDGLPMFFLWIYIIIECSFGYSRLQQIFLMLFVGSTLCFSLLRGTFHIGRFGSGYILMTIWSIIQYGYIKNNRC